MIRFYFLPQEGLQALPCIVCSAPTKSRAGYNPPGVKVEKPVCDGCYRQGAKLVRLVARLAEMRGR